MSPLNVTTMKIPAPRVTHGQTCRVFNYRAGRWENGRVRALAFKSSHGEEFHWSYTVQLDRPYKFRLYVGDDHIFPTVEREHGAPEETR